MTNLNWAILGPGLIAKEFAQALNNKGIKIYAVGSRTLEKAKEFAKEYNVTEAYGDYSEMLKDEKIDVVYISTPHNNHYQYIMESLENNKHVLCEKAITVNIKELSDIIRLAQEKNLVVQEATGLASELFVRHTQKETQALDDKLKRGVISQKPTIRPCNSMIRCHISTLARSSGLLPNSDVLS